MPPPPSHATLLGQGVRDALAALDLGWPVRHGFLGSENSSLAVQVYDVGDINDQITTGITTLAVQITVRGAVGSGANVISDIRQAVRDELTFVTPRVINTVPVNYSLQRLKPGPAVLDEGNRPISFDTYDMSVSRPALIPQV
jgi:hypothetical protein